LTVEAPTVVVACGAIESPALLLRSGIGGPAVGKNLRLHPAYVVMGVYDEPIEGWSGQIQSLVSDAYEDLEGEYGFLIEATGMYPGLIGAIFPWSDGTTHKQLMQSFRWQAPFITVARDHGSGEVVLDDLGRAVMRWGLGDEVDRRLAQRANVELCRLHRAAGAVEIFTAHASELRWRSGEDFEAFAERVTRRPTTRTTWRASRRTRWARAGWGRTRLGQWPMDGGSCTTCAAFGSGTAARSRRRRA